MRERVYWLFSNANVHIEPLAILVTVDKTIRNARGFFIAKITTIPARQQSDCGDIMNEV